MTDDEQPKPEPKKEPPDHGWLEQETVRKDWEPKEVRGREDKE